MIVMHVYRNDLDLMKETFEQENFDKLKCDFDDFLGWIIKRINIEWMQDDTPRYGKEPRMYAFERYLDHETNKRISMARKIGLNKGQVREGIVKVFTKRTIDYFDNYGSKGDQRKDGECLRTLLETWEF